MRNISQLKRLEHTIIKPTDLWTAEDLTLFLRYCPSKRDKAYFTVAMDSSCRPDEILKLRIRDIIFKTSGNANLYAEIVVNGKTGNRSIPLFASIPYVKDWIDDHPQGRNPNAFLIPSFDRHHKRFGNKMQERSLNFVCKRYKLEFFPALLEDPKVIPEDKKKIRDLLLKKFNPYIFRHSALTAKSKILKESTLRQHAGWSKNSDMPQIYTHFFGNESNENLLEAYGIVTEANKGNVLLPDSLRPRQCPNCNESNIPDCKFCSKCRMVLNYDAYEETIEQEKIKDNKVKELESRMKLFEESTSFQNSMLEMITEAMNIDTTALRQQLDKTVPKDQWEDVEYQRALRGIELAEKFKNKIVKDTLMPEVNNVAKNIIKNPELALDSIKRMSRQQ